MTMTSRRAACALATLLLLAVPLRAETAAGAAGVPGRFSFLGYAAPVPGSWVPLPPSSSFRAAQYRVPAAAGASEGEAIIFYFGAGQGGSAQANAARWASQFSRADGQPVAPQMQTLQVSGLVATLVELNGAYARQIGMGGGVAAKPGQTLLAAIIETPDGNLIVQLHGDQATVALHREGFEALVRGFKAR